jgi:hypothetical protein
MDVDGPEEWHVAPAVGEDGAAGEAGKADPVLDDDLDDELWAAPADGGLAVGRQGGAAPGGPVRRGVFGGNSTWATVVVAVLAAAMGVAVGLAFLRSPGPAGAAASPGGGSPASSAPAELGPPSGNGGYQQLQIIGTVTAVSRSSITIGGNGPSITGTFTGTTKFTGSAAGAADIKVGDQVAATLTGSLTNLTVTTIQDLAAQ